MYLAMICNLQWYASDAGKFGYLFKVKDLI